MESYKVAEEIIIIAIDDGKYFGSFYQDITWNYQNNKIKLIKQLTHE